MDYIKIIGILVLMPWISQATTIPTIPVVAPVYPGTASTTSATTNTSITNTATESSFKPITPIQRILSKKLTNSSDASQGRSVIGLSDLTFDADVQKIIDSATEDTPKRISNGYYDDEDDDEDEDEPPRRPYRRRRPYGLLSAMADKLYGDQSEPETYIAYANPYSSFVKKRPGRPRDKHHPYRKFGPKPYTEHYKFYSPYGGGYKRPPKRHSAGYYGLPIGGVYKDPWYTGMYRRPGRPYRDYDRYSDYRRHSKPPKFHKWKDHKVGDQQQSGGHVIEAYDDDDDDDKHEIIEHEPPPPSPPKHGYHKVMGPPPPEIMEKINKLYKKPCYIPHCDHYKKGFIKFSYKKIVFPKKVKIIPINPKKTKVKPVIVYQPAPEPVKYSSPPVIEEYPTKYGASPDVSDYHSHSADFQVPYGVTGFEYTPSYPTKMVEPYTPEFSKAPVQDLSYHPTYIPTDYGGDVSYGDGKQGSNSHSLKDAQKPSQSGQTAATSGYDSNSLQQFYPSNTFSYEGNHGGSASGGASYGGTSYGGTSTNSYGGTFHGSTNSYGGTSHGSTNSYGGTSNGGSPSYGSNSYSGGLDYGSYNAQNTPTNEGNSLKDLQGGKAFFKPGTGNSKGEPSHSSTSQYSASTPYVSYVLKPSGAKTVGTGYVKELEPKPSSSYNEKKFNALKSYYSDEAKYDKGPPKDPYGPTYMPEHDLSETYPYERSDKSKTRMKTN